MNISQKSSHLPAILSPPAADQQPDSSFVKYILK